MNRWQYQARTEPIIVESPPPEDNTADVWYPTIAYPPRRIVSLAAIVAGMAAMGSVTPLLADRVDWFVQGTDQFPPAHLTRPGYYTANIEPITPPPVLPDIPQTYDWDRSKIGPPDIRHYTMSLGPLGEPLIDWDVQEPDVVRRTPRPIEQPLFAQPLDPTLFPAVPGLDEWFQQQPDLVHRRRLFDYTQFVIDTEPVLDPFDWWHQTIDQVRPVPQPTPTYAEILLEPILPVLDIDWIVQQPGPIQPRRIHDPGWIAYDVEPLEFFEDWYLQEPEPVLPEHQVDPGWFAYNVLIITPPDSPELAWSPQYPDFARALPRPLDEGASWTTVEPGTYLIPDMDAWWVRDVVIVKPVPPTIEAMWTSIVEPIAAVPPTIVGLEYQVWTDRAFHSRVDRGPFHIIAYPIAHVRVDHGRFHVQLPDRKFHSRVKGK